MLLSLCVLSIVKARYCATPFGKAEDQLQERMNSSIRMETESPARMPRARKIIRTTLKISCALSSLVGVSRYPLPVVWVDPLEYGRDDATTVQFVFFGNFGQHLEPIQLLMLVDTIGVSSGFISPEITRFYGHKYT
ncbi:uncharacterized protein LOC133899799 [Phragmites australis]|uniref:uncharacterized protein LOC133899799 n=1 Tax=Phragmites australis TaxID=29695 RepID=UPI002D792470|nr:uncharacterized protein LOC133899799 [Phragmites australis]